MKTHRTRLGHITSPETLIKNFLLLQKNGKRSRMSNVTLDHKTSHKGQFF